MSSPHPALEVQLAGAALDIFQQEPYVPISADKDLRTLENVVLTSHVGSNTRESNNRMAEACLGNIKRFYSGNTEELNIVI